MAEVVDQGKTQVGLEEITGILDLFDAASHNIVRDPLLQIAGFRRDFLLPLHQLEDESDLVHQDDAIGELDILGGVDRKLDRREGERSQKRVFVLQSGELLEEARPTRAFHL